MSGPGGGHSVDMYPMDLVVPQDPNDPSSYLFTRPYPTLSDVNGMHCPSLQCNMTYEQYHMHGLNKYMEATALAGF